MQRESETESSTTLGDRTVIGADDRAKAEAIIAHDRETRLTALRERFANTPASPRAPVLPRRAHEL
jgi:hypothetical protein